MKGDVPLFLAITAGMFSVTSLDIDMECSVLAVVYPTLSIAYTTSTSKIESKVCLILLQLKIYFLFRIGEYNLLTCISSIGEYMIYSYVFFYHV
jgi:hypothetical protein